MDRWVFQRMSPRGRRRISGDVYAYLQHGGGISILLNRARCQPGQLVGYDDNWSIQVRFDDSGPDIRNYRAADETTQLAGPMRGTWSPDGWATDRADVLVGDARSSCRSSSVPTSIARGCCLSPI